MLRGAKRRGNPFPARHRRADGTSGTPSPTERFTALRAGRGSEFHPARGIPKRKTTQRVVFLFVITLRFCCSHSRIPQGRGSVRGEPLTGSPTRVQSPARRRPILRSKIAAPKKYDHPKGGRIFLERATRLELASRHPTNGRAIRRNPAFTSGFDALRAGRGSEFHPARGIPKRKHHPDGWYFLFGAGDEARTRYLDLGKVALYQMSYARKRKIDYTSHRSACQPRFPNFRKKLMPALTGGHAGIYRMMISTTPGLSALG